MPTRARDCVSLSLIAGENDGYGPNGFAWTRMLADGTVEPFTTPEHFLVITDVDWQYANGVPDTLQVLRLFVVPPPPPGPPSPPGDTRVFESAVVLSAVGAGGATVAMTTGFAVASGATIGLDLTPGPEMDGVNGSIQHAILHGYLTID